MTDSIRAEIRALKHTDEHEFVSQLIANPALPKTHRTKAIDFARELVADCRADTGNQSLLDAFLLEFGLSNKEGVALMCMAEALLRVPDQTNADRLIAEKISSGDWAEHTGNSDSLFVNAATWGMILTGKIVYLDSEITTKPGSWVKQLTSSLSEPVVRAAVMQAMRIMGGQYVLGRSIEEGFKEGNKFRRSHPNATIRYSFDMLGEAARTKADAERYFDAYMHALDAIGLAAKTRSTEMEDADGISVKLSALHPRYETAQKHLVDKALYAKIRHLCTMAKQHNIGLSIDAEEAARLELSLDIFERLCAEPELADWDGLGFVLQAYQKRASAVARWLVSLSEKYQRRLMVRLVKGAYWDAEIKHAQELGLTDYPVFTIKAHTDANYMSCAKILLSAPGKIYPQFATHNALTVTALIQLAKHQDNDAYEFQRLHGMGELLFTHLRQRKEFSSLPIRIYAPIGKHEDLLPYLVRRLLENGANSSFVNRFLDDETPVEELVADVIETIKQQPNYRHPQIPLPQDLYHDEAIKRRNSSGLDLDDDTHLMQLSEAIIELRNSGVNAASIINGEKLSNDFASIDNPNDTSRALGKVALASAADADLAIKTCLLARPAWQALGAEGRGRILYNWADALEQALCELVSIVSAEAGRTMQDGIDEVREAVDFCRYYANQAASERYQSCQPLGTVLCISPWNFPLAIFTGQISAALAAGNCVIAKPAEQTPAVATRAIELLLEAGCPADVIALLQGTGSDLGPTLLAHGDVNGVAFTGSTATANLIHQSLYERHGAPVPLLAETGGQNCMVVDSTALPEQVVDDVISSAFHSAGQRCSALRVLFVQQEVADKIITMLKDACDTVFVGDAMHFASDIGPIIDQPAKSKLESHIEAMAQRGHLIHRVELDEATTQSGHFFAPAIIEIPHINELADEVFGPVVHVIRFDIDEFDDVLKQINGTGYALTLGVHSRIESFADHVFRNTRAGNVYINRNTIGAVVGVNPFGGEALSGTGPKAGGPSYLARFFKTDSTAEGAPIVETTDIETWRATQTMPGPTGEENLLTTHPTKSILILNNNDEWIGGLSEFCASLGCSVRTLDTIDAISSSVAHEFDVLLVPTEHPEMHLAKRICTERTGPIVQCVVVNEQWQSTSNFASLYPHLVKERTKTDNLIARGGNAQLFNLNL
ncbi:MAG: bifunctional proline dehydrogenase/L-glutamate gamma-semialdehyde dehydrogenase PutA [Pseudomonadota bacterium]